MSELDDLEEIAEMIEYPKSERRFHFRSPETKARFQANGKMNFGRALEKTRSRPKFLRQLSAARGADHRK